jgi:carboxyl-terminal processing protease
VPPSGTLKDGNGVTASDMGYVHIREFSARTDQELSDAVKEVMNGGAKGLIIDVRSNLGGLLDPTIKSADLFLDSGTIIVQRDPNGKEQSAAARSGQLTSGIPIVVLQDRFSASASEVLAAALQENGRATIVGEKSFGKGTVNVTRPLGNGGALRVSVAQWLTPNKTLIDHVGIRPDVAITPTDEDIDARRDSQLIKAVDVLRGMMK